MITYGAGYCRRVLIADAHTVFKSGVGGEIQAAKWKFEAAGCHLEDRQLTTSKPMSDEGRQAVGAQIILLQVLKSKGYPDWKALARTIFEELGPDKDGEVSRDAAIAWLFHSVGVDRDQGRQIVDALVEMGMLVVRSTSEKNWLKLHSRIQ